MINLKLVVKKFNPLKVNIWVCSTVLLLAITLTAQPAHAMFGDAMAGVSIALKDFFSLISGTIFWIAYGLGALYITGSVLQWLINHQTTLISFDNGFVTEGLKITQSLADALLLLAFVVAALCIILKLFDFEAKKIIPSLLIAAIATRFGPLLVKMITDIGNIAINTIIANNGDIIGKVFDNFFADVLYMIATISGAVAATGLLYLVPELNIIAVGITLGDIISTAATVTGTTGYFGQLGSVMQWAGNGTLYITINYVVRWVFSIFAAYVLSGIFFSYIVLFASRIFMLQILAVISPLAIMAYGLPQTRQYFKKWWNSLIKWTFVGVWTLFFLFLGLVSMQYLIPDGSSAILGTGLGVGVSIDKSMLYYLFLIVYLALVKSMSGNDAVMGAMFQSAMAGVGGAAFTNVVKPVAGKIQKGAINRQMAAQSRIDEDKKAGKEASFSDKSAVHISGLIAKTSNEKTMSAWRGMFGNPEKAAGISQDAAKTWDLSNLTPGNFSKMTNIDSLIREQINDADKDSVEKIMGMKEKISTAQAISAMRRAKADDFPDLITAFGANASKHLDYAIKNDMLTPSTIQSIAMNTNMAESSSRLRDYLNKGSSAAHSAKINGYLDATARTGTAQEQQTAKETLQARANMFKRAAVQKETFKKLPDSVFEKDENIEAMLIGAETSFFHMAKEYKGEAVSNKVKDVVINKFPNLAKANPELVKTMAQNPGLYDEYIPTSVKNAAMMEAAQQNIDEDVALRNIVERMTH